LGSTQKKSAVWSSASGVESRKSHPANGFRLYPRARRRRAFFGVVAKKVRSTPRRRQKSPRRLASGARLRQSKIENPKSSPTLFWRRPKNCSSPTYDACGKLQLGKSSGPSGDFQLTRSTLRTEDGDFKTLIAVHGSRKFFPGTNVVACWYRAGVSRFVPPEANGGGASASRFAGAGCFHKADRHRKCVIAPPTESRRRSERQLGQANVAWFVCLIPSL